MTLRTKYNLSFLKSNGTMILLVLIFITGCIGIPTSQKVDLIIKNATIIHGDMRPNTSGFLIIDDSRIVDYGESEPDSYVSDSTIGAQGSAVCPGFAIKPGTGHL